MISTCIIAEHDPWDIRLFRVYVERAGFRVVQAYESQDVLPVAHRERPAVILLESELPGRLDPQAVLTGLKQDPSTHHVPVVILSWADTVAAREMIPGAASYLRKPATYEAFLAALTEAGVG